jgi:methylmalonyl-CoA mutase C-terminal domain/subunit
MATRVLVAKPGLDGHDKGAKIVARTLRDAGFEVIYTGIRQRIEDIVSIALQEDVALVGLSILSGAHIGLTKRTVDALRAADAGDIAVVVGGTIPESDVQKLLDAGAAAVFPTGTPLDTLVHDVPAPSAATWRARCRNWSPTSSGRNPPAWTPHGCRRCPTTSTV